MKIENCAACNSCTHTTWAHTPKSTSKSNSLHCQWFMTGPRHTQTGLLSAARTRKTVKHQFWRIIKLQWSDKCRCCNRKIQLIDICRERDRVRGRGKTRICKWILTNFPQKLNRMGGRGNPYLSDNNANAMAPTPRWNVAQLSECRLSTEKICQIR